MTAKGVIEDEKRSDATLHCTDWLIFRDALIQALSLKWWVVVNCRVVTRQTGDIYEIEKLLA